MAEAWPRRGAGTCCPMGKLIRTSLMPGRPWPPLAAEGQPGMRCQCGAAGRGELRDVRQRASRWQRHMAPTTGGPRQSHRVPALASMLPVFKLRLDVAAQNIGESARSSAIDVARVVESIQSGYTAAAATLRTLNNRVILTYEFAQTLTLEQMCISIRMNI